MSHIHRLQRENVFELIFITKTIKTYVPMFLCGKNIFILVCESVAFFKTLIYERKTKITIPS